METVQKFYRDSPLMEGYIVEIDNKLAGFETMTSSIIPARNLQGSISQLISPSLARVGFVFILAASVIMGLATSPAVPHDADLVRLLRFMAAVKAVLALGAAGAVVWRLGVGVTLPWFAAYALAGAAMAAGPGVIWGMAHVGLGAVLLHGGLAGTVLLLWRDQAAAGRLAAILAARR